MDKILEIEQNSLYKKVLEDSFGGIIHNIANLEKYSKTEVDSLINLWEALDPSTKESAGGIMKGAMHFLKREL